MNIYKFIGLVPRDILILIVSGGIGGFARFLIRLIVYLQQPEEKKKQPYLLVIFFFTDIFFGVFTAFVTAPLPFGKGSTHALAASSMVSGGTGAFLYMKFENTLFNVKVMRHIRLLIRIGQEAMNRLNDISPLNQEESEEKNEEENGS